jgi:hypothetical protein
MVLLIILVVCYFIPTVVAFSRKHHNAGAICALNIFLGWTVVGWVTALVWALTRPAPPAPAAG